MKKFGVGLLGMLLIAVAQAAPVVDTSAPGVFAPPDATELANASSVILPVSTPGSIVNPMRSAPTTEVNPGLDGQEPAPIEDADSLELGIVPLPEPSHACPPGTPVTVSVSEWTITLVNASPSAAGAGGGGSGLMDSRNLSVAAPASSATFSGTSNPAGIGSSSTIAGRQYAGTFADLPFLTLAATINAVRISTPDPVQSHYRAVVPSVTLTYDDGPCTLLAAAASEPQSVHATSTVALVLLSAMLLVLALAVLSRRA